MKKIKNLKVYEGMLIIVDMVEGFINKGVLHDQEIKKIVTGQIELIKEARNNGYAIIFIKDTHTKESVEHKRFPDFHCLVGSGEEELIEELKEYENKEDVYSISKNSTSFMEALDFRIFATDASNVKKVEIVGCCTDICVANGAIGLANFYDEKNRNVEIDVYVDMIATYNEAERRKYVDAALLLMEQQGIKLVKKK